MTQRYLLLAHQQLRLQTDTAITHGQVQDQLRSKTMAHFAQLNENNVVTQVIVVHNNELMDNGAESEANGVAFCQSLFGADTVWKQTSYNGNFRKNYAGIGFTFDEQRDAFIPPKPYASWVLSEDTCQWKAPADMPTDGAMYSWDEATTSWTLTGDNDA